MKQQFALNEDGSQRLVITYERIKNKVNHIQLLINETNIKQYADLSVLKTEGPINTEIGEITLKYRFGRFYPRVNGKNLWLQKTNQIIHRFFGECGVMSAIFFAVLLLMEGLSWLLSGHSLILIWQKGRLSVFPLWLIFLAFGLMRFGLGWVQIKRPHWLWILFLLGSFLFEVRFIRSVYELWFFPFVTIFLVPALWVAIRLPKVQGIKTAPVK